MMFVFDRMMLRTASFSLTVAVAQRHAGGRCRRNGRRFALPTATGSTACTRNTVASATATTTNHAHVLLLQLVLLLRVVGNVRRGRGRFNATSATIASCATRRRRRRRGLVSATITRTRRRPVRTFRRSRRDVFQLRLFFTVRDRDDGRRGRCIVDRDRLLFAACTISTLSMVTLMATVMTMTTVTTTVTAVVNMPTTTTTTVVMMTTAATTVVNVTTHHNVRATSTSTV